MWEWEDDANTLTALIPRFPYPLLDSGVFQTLITLRESDLHYSQRGRRRSMNLSQLESRISCRKKFLEFLRCPFTSIMASKHMHISCPTAMTN